MGPLSSPTPSGPTHSSVAGGPGPTPWWQLGLGAGLGAVAGALARFGVDTWLGGWVGLCVVNLVGTVVLFAVRPRLGEPWRTLVVSGFCGGLTTFSALAVMTALEAGSFHVPVRLAATPTLAGSMAAVAIGGFFGGLLRWGLDRTLRGAGPAAMPWGIVVSNIGGSIVLGWALASPAVSHWGVLALGTGMAGAWTTFSTFAADTWDLGREGTTGRALGYVTLTCIGALAGATVGLWAGGRHGLVW